MGPWPWDMSRKSRKPHFLVSPWRKKDDDMTMGSLLSSLHNGMFHVAVDMAVVESCSDYQEMAANAIFVLKVWLKKDFIFKHL